MSMRLPQHANEWIDRSKPIRFSFEGKQYTGFEGDTITSALLAAGVKVLGRSFKYHRARGVLSMANHDVNVMLTDGVDTNIRGDVVLLKEGMNLTVVNTDGGVLKDKKKFIDSISPLLPVGFYYKAFHKPAKFFPFWEKLIRKAAGLGVVNFDYPRITKPKLNEHCDLLVIGAGASGLSAALYAAEQGLKVVLVDENAQLGGSLTYDKAGITEDNFLLKRLVNSVKSNPNIKIYLSAYAAGYYADHMIPIVTEAGITRVRAQSLIAATGAFEQPPVFRNNDLPSVVLGSAAQRLVHRYAIKPFNLGVVVTANDYGYRAALDLINAGCALAAIVDMRASGADAHLTEQFKQRGVKLYSASCILEAIPTPDKLGISAVKICPYDELKAEPDTKQAITIACDGVVMSAGWAPAGALLYQAGTSMRYDNSIQQFVPKSLPKGIFAAGKVNGVFGLEERLLDGEFAAKQALQYLGKISQEACEQPSKSQLQNGSSPSHPYPIVPHPKGKNFIDFDEDIQLKDFINAAQEGFDNIELMKRFTTVGMGPSQGKHSNMNAIRILAKIRDLPVEKIGTTTARPFFHPTPMGHLAGRSFHPHRLTAMHCWHESQSAVFVDAGAWKRPAYYANNGLAKADAINVECLAVRKSVGMIDAGTLGKIEICGPDAPEFLERFYTGSFASQKVGETRYALLLDESGVVVDDGIAARLNENLFYVTASTANSAAVYREMQRWQQRWQLNIGLINVTGAYGAMNVAGPKASSTLQSLTDFDLNTLAFGAISEAEICGVPARIIRVGFVSNLAFEIHVPTSDALSVWTAIFKAGDVYGIRPFGTDAQRLLRLEMGHHITGHDTDGLTHPFEIGAEFALRMNKPFFIGQRSLKIIQQKPLTKKLVAFTLAKDFSGEMPQDCNLVIEAGEIKGRVTSISLSPSLNQIIGLAYVHPSQATVGSQFDIRTDSGALVSATVVKAPFISKAQLEGHTASETGNKSLSGMKCEASLFSVIKPSPIAYAQHAKDVQIHDLYGMEVVWKFSDQSTELQRKSTLGVTDVSCFQRLGFKGAGASDWLSSRGLQLPPQANTWLEAAPNTLVLRLGNSEYLIEDQLNASLTESFKNFKQGEISGVYQVARADASFLLTGNQLPQLLSELCMLNLQGDALPENALVMTQFAGISATLLKQKFLGEEVIRVWCDASYGAYMWEMLLELAEELGGGAVGLGHFLE